MHAAKLHLIPLLAIASAALGLSVAAPAGADCNYSGGATLCSSSGEVRGGSAPPPSSGYSPYPCGSDPSCLYYDNWDPNIYLDWGNIGRPGRPGGGGGIGGGGGGGIGGGGGGGIGPR